MIVFIKHPVHQNPGGLVQFTGEYDADGKAKIRAVIEILHANTLGEVPDDQVAYLTELGVIREPTDQEMLLHRLATGAYVPAGEG